MTLDELGIHELGLINYIDCTHEDISALFLLGVVPGIEIRKLSSVKTCSEYFVENVHGSIVIDTELAKYINIDKLEEDMVV